MSVMTMEILRLIRSCPLDGLGLFKGSGVSIQETSKVTAAHLGESNLGV